MHEIDSTDWYTRTQRHHYHGEFGQALVCIEHFLKSFPTDLPGRILYAEILADLRRFREAEQVLRDIDLPQNHRGYWLLCYAWTILLRHQSKYRQAADWARRLAESRPNWSVGHIYLGSCLARLGEFDDACAAYQLATELPADDDNDPDEAYLNIAYIRRAQGQYAEALKALNRAIEIDPTYDLYRCVRDDVIAALDLEQQLKGERN